MNTNSTQTAMRVFLAVDGSPNAQAAAEFVGHLPLPAGSQVFVEAVIAERGAPDEATMQSALEVAQALLTAEGIEISTHLRHGQAAAEIKRSMSRLEPDLAVVGANSKPAMLDFLMGSVAQHVMQHAPCPVLVVRAPFRGLRRILAALDDSSESRRASEYLAHLPLPAGVEVSILHVLPPRPLPMPVHVGRPIALETMPTPDAIQAAEQAAERLAEAQERDGWALVRTLADVFETGGLEARPELARGDAATEIARYASSHEVDLVVCGSRGLGALTGWILGSVSGKLAHGAQCSILIAKDTTNQQEVRMSTVKQLQNKPLISLTNGRRLGEIRDVYFDSEISRVVAVLVKTEGLLNRKPFVIQRARIQVYGEDAWLVSGSDSVVELTELGEADKFVPGNDLMGREIQTEGGTKIGSVGDVQLDPEARVAAFSLDKVYVVGPLSERRVIARKAITKLGGKDEPMTTILAQAETAETPAAQARRN